MQEGSTNTVRGGWRKPLQARRTGAWSVVITRLACLLILLRATNLFAAAFSGDARVEIADQTSTLSFDPQADSLSIACWFKLTVPTDKALTENMTILVNRRGGSEGDTHSYLIQFNHQTGNIEFSARGDKGRFAAILIERPYLERWYHVAVARRGEEFAAFLDGRTVNLTGSSLVSSGPVGNSRTSEGISIGGWGDGRSLFGEVQEVSVYQSFLERGFWNQYMFENQPTNIPSVNLRGYFKLGYSTNTADQLRNFSPAPAADTLMGTTNGPGKVGFEEANQAGEQSLFDARRNGGRDAVTPLGGAFSWSQTVFSRPTTGIAFDFRIGYGSANAFGGFALGSQNPYSSDRMGKGWRHTFEARLIPSQDFLPSGSEDILGLMLWDGSIETWVAILQDQFPTDNYQTRHKEYRGELYKTNSSFFEWRTPERIVYRFLHPFRGPELMRGRLTEIRDFNGNVIKLNYDAVGLLKQVVDSAQGKYDLNYRNDLLTSISFNSWQVNFEYVGTNLVAKWLTNTAPASAGIVTNVNTRWGFRYGANGLLSGVVDPLGNTNLLVFYDKYGRQTNLVDALLRTNRMEYGVPAKRQMRRTDPEGHQWIETFDRKGRLLAQQDPLTNVTHYTYDDRGNRTSITEPLGWRTFFSYDERANVVARTNALGQVATWKFHSFFNKAIEAVTPQPTNVNGFPTWTNFYELDDRTGNLLRHHDGLDPFGTLVSYRYETNGLVLTATNANGFVTSFAYDTNGFLLSRTEPFATNANSIVTTTYVVNDVGWKLRETNPLGDPTSYDFDLNGNPVRVQDVLGRVYQRTYDPNGNLLSTTDGKGLLTTFGYDAANQRTHTTDRTGTNVWSTTYTPRGKPDRVTDPFTNTVTSTYDAANRLVRVTDPLGGSVTNQYDANGNSVAVFDKLGRRWSKTYDRLNRVEAESDPLSNTRRTSYDEAGRILQTTTPNGHPTLHAYDGRGRLTLWQDAEGFEWRYTYDGVGNITDIEDAEHGHYVMTYGPRSERTLERNQDNKEWRYEYDELLRLKVQTDPNGITRTSRYDPAGRIKEVRFSTGRFNRFEEYDKNDNLERVEREDANGQITRNTFEYDVLDRLTKVVDTFTRAVLHAYDPLGRVTTLTYPGGKTLTNHYDELGRLKRQVDWAGRELTYGYDLSDRLVRRTWPNGVVQTNAFDTAGRLTALSHSTFNPQPSTLSLALTYAYDRNGNTTGSTEKGTLRWPQPALTDETSTFTPSGRLQTRTIADLSTLNSPPLNWTYSYDSSGNLTNAAVTGGPAATSQSWALRYDEDNRTTSLAWTTNGVTHTVQNRYDALGRRVARTLTEGGTSETTGYVLSLTGGMERILCDVTATGDITAWYVHGPDLCYRVVPQPDGTEQIQCYHTDAQANVIALTGANGTNLVQYAYTPYGRVLGTTNYPPSSILSSQPYKFVGSQGVMEEFPGLYFMRARYYSAEAGVFLSTDPVKKIGPGWKPTAYGYANNNPYSNTDPSGNQSQSIARIGRQFLAEAVFDVIGMVYVSVLQVGFGYSQEEAIDAVEPGVQGLDERYGGGLGGAAWNRLIQQASDHPLSQPNTGIDSVGGRAFSALSSSGQAAATGSLNSTKQQITQSRTGVEQSVNQLWSRFESIYGPNAVPQYTFQNEQSSSGKPTSTGAVNAINTAQNRNRSQQTNPVGNSNGSGPTTQSGSNGGASSGGGSNAFTRVVNTATTAAREATNSITQAVQNAATTVGQAIGNAVRAVGNFFGGLIGGGKKP